MYFSRCVVGVAVDEKVAITFKQLASFRTNITPPLKDRVLDGKFALLDNFQ